MSQSLLYHASGVRAGYRYRRTEYVEGRVEFHLAVKLEKVRCPHCGSDSYTHYTRVLARYVCDLSRVMSLRDVSRLTQLGWDTVKAIVKNDLRKRYARVPLHEVRRIAIDENYLGAKAKDVTLVIDLHDGRILWVGEGRGKDALAEFWTRLRVAKARIKAVACDMSAAYGSAVQEHLPEAALVFDRLLSLPLHPAGSLRLAISLLPVSKLFIDRR